jgi:signal transduction histidine kinase
VKIGQRLALRFMIVSALVTGAILIFIYVVTRGFVHADFIDRLTQQSSLEVLHYATPQVRDVIPAGAFSLVNPSTSIYTKDHKLLQQSGSYDIPDTWVNFLDENTVFNAERGEYTTVGRQHEVNDVLYLVFVSDKDLPGQRELNFLIQALVVGWIISLLLSYITGLYFSSNALQPVKRVVMEVNQITEDNLSYRLNLERDVTAQDEIDELILTFNALLRRIEKAFIAQKRFVQNASHELKTPLTAIMADVELTLTRLRTPEEYQRSLNLVMHEAERLASITQGLLTLARLEEGSAKTEMESVDLKKLWDQTQAAFRLHHPDRVVEERRPAPEVFVQGNSHLLQTALLNLLDNAAKYSRDRIEVDLVRSGKEITIAIRDKGIGIPEKEMQRIRSPLFRAANAHDIAGSGLGLSLVDRIMEIHGGHLQILSKEGEGTTCVVKLPVLE